MQQQLVIQALAKIGELYADLGESRSWKGFDTGVSEQEYNDFDSVIKSHKAYNGWFTEDSIRFALSSWANLLTVEKLNDWAGESAETKGKTIAVIAAGNIPMVGLHDVLAVLISGNKLKLKCSSEDNKLIPFTLKILTNFYPEIKDQYEIVEHKLEGFDAVIATGSNNTSKYFESYFSKYPNIIRKNRTSVAIVESSDTQQDLSQLGKDIFQYFGLGCRNVSKMYIPNEFDLDLFFKSIFDFNEIVHHNKYANNYDYQKAIHLMNRDEILDNGFLLLKEDERLHSPLGMLYYERYDSLEDVNNKLNNESSEIQCVVGSNQAIGFGNSQNPSLKDYADNINTLEFLSNL